METVPQTIQIASYSVADVNDFCEIVYDYSMRLSEVQTDYNRICKTLEECFEFVQNIDVPFAFEYTKASYKRGFQQYRNDLLSIRTSMEEFPQIVEINCLIALNSNTHQDKKNCINYLDNLLSYFNVLLANLEYSINNCINRGLQAYQQSKRIVCRCK
jgi:hypothetical protein